MVSTQKLAKAYKTLKKIETDIGNKRHSWMKTLLRFLKCEVESKENKSKLAYMKVKLDYKQIKLQSLEKRQAFRKMWITEQEDYKMGKQLDEGVLKKREQYKADLYLRQTRERLVANSGVTNRDGKRNPTDMEAETESHNSLEDDNGNVPETGLEPFEMEALNREESSYYEGEDHPSEIETEIENDGESDGSEVEQAAATETNALPENTFETRSPKPEGEQGASETGTVQDTTQDSDDELLIRVVCDNINNTPNCDNVKRMIAWQIERHIQWTSSSPEWENKSELCEMIGVKSAPDLRRGKIGKGNMTLNGHYCAYDSEGYKWGRPAAELKAGARRLGKSDAWMFYDEPRRFLLALENWYFQLDEEERDDLHGGVFEWYQFRDACIGDSNYESWEGAFGNEITGFYVK
jgi:hypothetical protein